MITITQLSPKYFMVKEKWEMSSAEADYSEWSSEAGRDRALDNADDLLLTEADIRRGLKNMYNVMWAKPHSFIRNEDEYRLMKKETGPEGA